MAEKFLPSLKKLFFHPTKFFSSVEKDKDYSKVMFFYVKMTVVATIVSFVCSLILLSVQNKIAGAGIFNLLTSGIVSIGFAFLIPFIISFIVHIGVLIFKGRKGYFSTYKSITYPLTITLIYGIFSTIIVNIIGITSPVSISQEQLTTNPELILQEPGFIASMVIAFIILLISLIHSLTVQVIGIAKFQKMSKLRAFFAIIVIPLILIIIGIIFLYYYTQSLMSAGV